MSYESEMKITKMIWVNGDKSGPGYHHETIEVGDYRNMPLSKLPIQKKLFRAIMERRQFSNLGSNVGTAIRWVGDTYIVSCRPTWDASKVWDVAVGRRGEYPFMFRSPFTGDPTSGLRPDFYSDGTKMEKVTPKLCYYYYYSVPIATRLNMLGFYIFRKQIAVGRKMNEKTHRMNNVYATVPHLFMKHALIDPPEIGQNNYEVMLNNKGFKEIVIEIPLLKSAWYFRTGTIASESQNRSIDINKI